MKDREQLSSASAILVKDVTTPEDVKQIDYDRDIDLAGQPLYTRGDYVTMHHGRLQTIRRLSSFNTAERQVSDSERRHAAPHVGNTGLR